MVSEVVYPRDIVQVGKPKPGTRDALALMASDVVGVKRASGVEALRPYGEDATVLDLRPSGEPTAEWVATVRFKDGTVERVTDKQVRSLLVGAVRYRSEWPSSALTLADEPIDHGGRKFGQGARVRFATIEMGGRPGPVVEGEVTDYVNRGQVGVGEPVHFVVMDENGVGYAGSSRDLDRLSVLADAPEPPTIVAGSTGRWRRLRPRTACA